MKIWRSAAVGSLILILYGCALIVPKDDLTSDDFRHTAEQQGDFELGFANCKVDADRIKTDGPPVDGEAYRDRLNASDRALVQCMHQRGYVYRDKDELLLP